MILSKQEFIDSLTNYLPDNANQEISPLDLRTVITNLADSIHLMTASTNIDAANMGTKSTRTSIFGQEALGKLDLVGRSSSDNSVFGYNALNGNYEGTHNTAIGSQSISCNVYGDHNVGVGVSALGGNTTGSGNIGIGNYTLHRSRTGSFNIAIGHAAGNYIGETDSYKFYLGAIPVEQDDNCLVEDGVTSLTPLMHGNLEDNLLAINTNSLHTFGTLQVAGDASPSDNAESNLGHGSKHWKMAYISSGISYPNSGTLTIYSDAPKGVAFPDQYNLSVRQHFDGNGNIGFGTNTPSGDYGLITVAGNVVPSESGIFALGHPLLTWDAYLNDVVISGQLRANNTVYNEIGECIYECKTLHLGSSGLCDEGYGFHDSSVCGYLSDAGLEGAWFEIHASGEDYVRYYRLIYKQPDVSIDPDVLSVDNSFSRSHFESNISLKIADGNHLKTQRVLGKDKTSIVTESGYNGLFIIANESLPLTSGSYMTFGQVHHASGDYVGKGNVSFFGASGDNTYDLAIASVDSGSLNNTSLSNAVRVGLDFTTAVADTNRSRFSLRQYNFGHPDYDRFVIGSEGGEYREHDHTRVFEPVTIAKSGMYVGISNYERTEGSAPEMPQAHLHIQGGNTGPFAGNTVVRIGTRTGDTSKDSIFELTGNGAEGASGLRVSYDTSTDYIDFSTIATNSTDFATTSGFLSVTNDNYIGIGSTITDSNRTFTPIEPLTINHYNAGSSGTIAMKEQEKKPTNTADYGKIYVKPKVAASQTQALYFLDDGGNEFNIVTNIFDIDNTQLVWSDVYSNTFAGSKSPASLPVLGGNTADNTVFGSNSLNSIVNSSYTASGNTVFGARSLNKLTDGDLNTIVGNDNLRYKSGDMSNNIIVGQHNLDSGNSSSYNNIIIGNNNFNSIDTAADNSIIIGNSVATNAVDWSDKLLIGYGTDPLVSGQLTGSKYLAISEADFYVTNGNVSIEDTNKSIEYNIIPKTETVNGDDVSYIDTHIKDTFNSSVASGVHRLVFTTSNDTSGVLVENDFRKGAMPVSPVPTYASTSNPTVTINGDINVRGQINYADGTSNSSSFGASLLAGDGLSSTTVLSDKTFNLDILELQKASSASVNTLNSNSYVAVHIEDGAALGGDVLGKMSFAELTSFLGSGYASVVDNHNHFFAPPKDEKNISQVDNSDSIFIGPGVGYLASGWKHSIMIGTDAGHGATTNNPDLSTDTASTFIGYNAGREADNISNSLFIGTNAGNYAKQAIGSIFIGQNAGSYSETSESIGIGKNALRGSVGGNDAGVGNIEIVANLQDNQRLLYNKGTYSNLLNIQNTIAGDTSIRRISIGDTVIGPDAVLSVRKDNTITGHSTTDYIQTWWHNDSKVAQIDCSGNFESLNHPPVIEGFTTQQILAPTQYTAETSGKIIKRNLDETVGSEAWVVNRDSTLAIDKDLFVVAYLVNGEYRPIHVACSGA